MSRFFRHLRIAFWRAFEHDAFGVAKGAAFSAILTFFPAILVLASILSRSRSSELFVHEIFRAMGRILPEGTSATIAQYMTGARPVQTKFLVSTGFLTLWTASGVMISWMEGFRKAYQMPKIWGLVKERLIAFLLVVLAGVPMGFASFLVVSGNMIERWTMYHVGHGMTPYILGLWTAMRWIIATLTSIAVIGLVYHHGVPRTQPWHRVLPGSVVATILWVFATVLFGWYVRSFANYDVIYGSVGTAIALLVWLYLVSMVVLIGAEFNAVRYPRFLFGAQSQLNSESRRVAAR
ncbi:MAG: YihY/virulence factor BrkB family protein [Candidatus Korobacteraceae bacterium]